MEIKYIKNSLFEITESDKVSKEMHAQIVQCIKDSLEIAKNKFDCHVIINELQYSKALPNKIRAKSGYSKEDKWFITLSLFHIEKDDFNIVLKETIPHQISHIAAIWLANRNLPFGDYGHGEAWKSIATALGCTPATTRLEKEPLIEDGLYKYKNNIGTFSEVNQEQHDFLQHEKQPLHINTGKILYASGFISKIKDEQKNVFKKEHKTKFKNF